MKALASRWFWGLAALQVALLAWTAYVEGPPRELPETFWYAILPSFLPYFLAVYFARTQQTPSWKFVLIVALLLRAPFYGLYPALSDDLFRYLWDGKVQLAGINPYLYAPSDPALLELRDKVWAWINHPELTTPYPPVAQILFLLGYAISSSAFGVKLLLGLCDVAAILALMDFLRRKGKEPGLALVYAWNPLLVVEFAWSGHIDAAALGLMVVAIHLLTSEGFSRRIRLLGGFVFGMAVLSKYLPLLAIPAIWVHGGKEARRGLVGAFAAMVFVLPYIGAGKNMVGSVGTYGRRWYFNESVYGLIYKGTHTIVSSTIENPVWAPLRMLRRVVDPQNFDQKHLGTGAIANEADTNRFSRFQISSYIARGICGVLLLFLVVWGLKKRSDVWQASLVAFAAFLALSPTVHPWYTTWGVPFLVMRRGLWMLAFSALVLLSYHVLESTWKLETLFWYLEYLPVALFLLGEGVWNWKQQRLQEEALKTQSPPTT